MKVYYKFLCNSGEVEITDDEIQVKMKKKRNLPALLGEMEKFRDVGIPLMQNKKLVFSGSSTT